MGALSYGHAATLLNTSLRGSTVYLGLFLTNPTAGNTGTEVSGGGYARKVITFGAPSTVNSIETCTNSAAVDFGEFSANIGTVSYWGIYDASSAGNLLWFGAFQQSKNVEIGDSIVVAAGDLTVTLG